MEPNPIRENSQKKQRSWSKPKVRNLSIERKKFLKERRSNHTLSRRDSIRKIRRLQRSYLANPYLRYSKRTFDVVISALVVLCVLSWLYPILFVLIKIESEGPVIFRQKRNGLDLEPFWCLKFRSMRINEEADTLPVQHGDNRITRVGHYIRKYSIDEMPQFINVLRGEMSVVGPRPHMISETNSFNELSADFYKRHEVKPGITGLAQISNCRGEIGSVHELTDRVKYDLFYIRKASMSYDFLILFKTAIRMFNRDEKAR